MASGVGPKDGPEAPDAKKSKKSIESDAFKDMMRVGKVREVDPEEQRKRKSRQEVEADAAGMFEVSGSMPGLNPASTSDTDDTFQINVSNLSSTAPSSSSASSSSATPDEYSEEEINSTPPPPDSSYPQEEYIPQLNDPLLSSSQPQQTTDQTSPQDSTGKVKKGKKKGGAEGVVKPQKLKKEKIDAPPAKMSKESPVLKKETAFPEKREVFPEKLTGALPSKEEVEETVANAEAPPLTSLPLGSWEKIKEKSEEKKGVDAIAQVTPNLMPDILPPGIEVPSPVSPALAAPFAQFPQMWDIFDRMVGVITVMNDSGITETTINLTSDQFKASPFFGTQIIVREFSTAPKVFNIEMHVPTQVAGQIRANYNELVAAFQSGQYNFKVNRLEWSELTSRREEEKKGKVTKTKKSKKEE